jgi:CDGSH-type Zn-finger protein/truncated hemoglobin YjbI
MPRTDNDSADGRGPDQLAVARREMRSLLARASQLAQAAQQGSDRSGPAPANRAELQFVANRLSRSVARPLRAALAGMHDDGDEDRAPTAPDVAPRGDAADEGTKLGELLWQLAKGATRLCLQPGLPGELREATAALQDLGVRRAPGEGPEAMPARVAELRQITAGLPRRIQLAGNGPYLATNIDQVTNWLGERVEALPQMALCRCGASALKPLCDGSHADVGFVDVKDPKRVRDRRDTYVGQQVTILDNRGTCQHSGFCTDRLSPTFHLGEEPFVTPSGGRMDEIIRAVRDCPSGALSFAMDGREAREQVDHGQSREPSIEVSKDGPYRVTGGVALVDSGGDEVERNLGASLEHYALCRCGHSQNKPFCSGMHWYAQFKDPVPGADHEPTIFEWCGGLPALTRMTRLFYERYVPQDPLLAPLFATMSADHPERVAKWLAEVFGGPRRYSEEYGGYPRMISQHIGKGVTEDKRARWVELMLRSAVEAGLPNDPEFRSVLGAYIEWGSRLAVENSQVGWTPPETMPVPHWDWNTSAGPPGSRIAARPPEGEETKEAEPQVELPGADEPVLFARHIKPLFRRRDRQSMRFAFDLWAHSDVKQNAQGILDRLVTGSMPCDGAWPSERVDAFRRWVESGMEE